MVKILNINVFHEKGVPRFYIENLEHPCFSKKERRRFFNFLWRIKKLGHLICYIGYAL